MPSVSGLYSEGWLKGRYGNMHIVQKIEYTGSPCLVRFASNKPGL